MNEYNHHRIIERVAYKVELDSAKKQILKDASNFSDFFLSLTESAKNKYFFYLFYYDLTIKGNNTIKLDRITKNYYGFEFDSNNSIRCMKKSGEKLMNNSYSLVGWNPNYDEKEFFSSLNDRKRSPNDIQFDSPKELEDSFFNNIVFDTANQSDNVAFLHAMGAVDENKNESREVFEKHLKKCFSEYLFLENERDALFMLGIAFHGIMDSFTPSHMDFQKYTEQDMGLHAQGDVIPILGKFNKKGELEEQNISEEEEINFDPGQYKKEKVFVQQIFRRIKYYNDDNYVNPVEYEMLHIFLFISKIQKRRGDGWNDVSDIEKFWQRLNGCTKKQIDKIISKENYRYGPESYAYSEAAIKVISDIYNFLCKMREICNSYSEYKKSKQEIADEALKKWKRVYFGNEKGDENDDEKIDFWLDNCKYSYSMKKIRRDHIGLSFYSKKPELEKWKELQARQNVEIK